MNAARAIPVLALLVLAAPLAAGVWLLSATPGTLVKEAPPLLGPTPGGEPVIVQVEDGDSASEIADKLEEAGVIQSARLFRVLTALMALGDELVAGDYEFERGETALTAIQRISAGATAPLLVTIPEGLRAEEIGEKLENAGVVSAQEFLRALGDVYDASFLAELPAGSGLEGFLFPATYGFSRGEGGHDVVQRLLNAFDQRYQDEIRPLLPARSRLSLHQAITLASIIEREAQVQEERPTIAGVFLNRLELGFLLQADPTVQYALGSNPASVQQFGYWKQGLTQADLGVASPYNTYQTLGLPPGPIANPGLDAILAALEPADTNFLFFVACTDGSGRHAFAATLAGHNQNVAATDGGACPQ